MPQSIGRPKKGEPSTARTCALRAPRRHGYHTEDTLAACSDSKDTEKISFPSTELSTLGVTIQGGLQSCSHSRDRVVDRGMVWGALRRLDMPSWHVLGDKNRSRGADKLSQVEG